MQQSVQVTILQEESNASGKEEHPEGSRGPMFSITGGNSRSRVSKD